ncbi:MAG: precorrin-6A reductase [Oscillospiraceae bacterium]|nr:precorrin-6A reductase [Oscillospiraceae bacterium]
MRIVIFSGTTEGRELSRLLAGRGAEIIVSVATEYGSEEQGSVPGIRTHIGPLTAEEKQELLQGAALCVDATHPYATHVTASIRKACEQASCDYRRLLRVESSLDEGAVVVSSAAQAAAYLARTEGNVLLTTGAKELGNYAALPPERLYPRVLPSHESLRACEALGVPHRNILAMQGPFSQELNEALMRQYDIRWLVTKDGGAPGGFPEKAAAAAATGASLLVIHRPAETGESFEQVLACCEALIDKHGQT